MAIAPIFVILAACFGVALMVLLLLFVLVPVCKGIGFLLGHIFSFIGGMVSDALRFVGAILALVVLAPLAPLNVIIGRWSAASHFVASVKREFKVAAGCLYRIGLQRPLRLVFLGSLLEGLEQRVPEAMAGAPTRDKPSKKRAGQFDGYRIVGSLKGGGSGGKLYIAEPDEALRNGPKAMPDRVVIKSFALSEGSSLPQIVRESRALEAARQLGLVLDHSMSEQHFYYIMPYHPGDHLGIITRQMHAESGEKGLGNRQLTNVLQYVSDLVATLSTYHEGGLWHKDVKPENVIVHDNRAHVVDLGLVTPLRSAMTLTTHGTEYFRDPEMVRQALRGAKVHQIDCTKFDIYAAGAVLYFMLENTFPAHGGLSKFHQKSPEALRWVVRRAMSEYNKRYDSADAMLADLAVVMEARDPFSVRPADLPSMGGAAVPLPEMPADTLHSGIDHQLAPDHATVDANVDDGPSHRRPRPPFAAAAAAGVAGVAGAANAAYQRTRPKLQVMNWWTGAYRVDDDGVRGQAPEPPQASYAAAIPPPMRQSARDQIKSARDRAREMRSRVRDRRKTVRAGAERQPGLALVVITLLVLGGLFAAGALFAGGRRTTSFDYANADAGAPGTFVMEAGKKKEELGYTNAILLINEHPQSDLPAVQHKIDKIIVQYEHKGYHVITEETEANQIVLDAFELYKDDPRGEADGLIEDAMELRQLAGVLHIFRSEGYDRPEKLVGVTMLKSSQRQLADRRYLTEDMMEELAEALVQNAPTNLPFLFINDHPEKFDDEMKAAIDQRAIEYTNHGWDLRMSAEAEAEVRKFLPVKGVNIADAVELKLAKTLAEHGFVGVFRVDKSNSEGGPEEQITIDKIYFESIVTDDEGDVIFVSNES